MAADAVITTVRQLDFIRSQLTIAPWFSSNARSSGTYERTMVSAIVQCDRNHISFTLLVSFVEFASRLNAISNSYSSIVCISCTKGMDLGCNNCGCVKCVHATDGRENKRKQIYYMPSFCQDVIFTSMTRSMLRLCVFVFFFPLVNSLINLLLSYLFWHKHAAWRLIAAYWWQR